MDNIFRVEVKQTFTHTNDDGVFISWCQLLFIKYEVKFSSECWHDLTHMTLSEAKPVRQANISFEHDTKDLKKKLAL